MKKWLRRLAVALLVLVGVLLFGALSAWLYLTSEAGSERVRTLALKSAQDALAGKVEAKTLSLKDGHIVLEDLKLYTPEGELVAELARAELELKLGALVAKDVVIKDAKLDGVRLYLKSDERGLNLTRAVAAKQPSLATGEKSTAAVRVDVQQLSLTNGYVSWQDEYVLDGISIGGAAEVQTGERLKLHGKLDARATLQGETPLPLTLEVAGDQAKLSVAAKLSEAHLDGELSLDDLSAHIAELYVPPEVADRFAGESPLKVPLTARGKASPRELDLELEAGKARAKVAAKLAGSSVPSFAVKAEQVDLAELLGRGQPSQLSIDAHGGITDTRLESLDGTLDVDAAWTKVGTLKVKAGAKAGALKVEQLALDVRGASLDARGSGDATQVRFTGELVATDLAQLARVLGEVTGSEPLQLTGAGQVNVSLSGPPRHPRLQAKGALKTLGVNGLALTQVTFEGGLADVTRPFEARLQAEAARIVASGRSFESVRASLDTRGRELDLLLSTKGLADLSLAANGTVDADGRGVALAMLTLRYPEAEWRLESPTHLSIANGLEVDPLVLVAADQRLALQAKLVGGRVDALLDAKNLDLARLPHAFVPPSLGLSGRLDAHATATGRSAAPEAEATLAWRNGTVRTVKGLQLTARARYAKDRASGALDGTASIGAVKGTFDLPVKGLQKGSDEPLSADVTVDGVLLEALGPLLQTELPLTGTASVRLQAEGTAKRPRVVAHAVARDAEYRLDDERTLPVEALQLDVTPADDGALSAVATVNAFGAEARVSVKTPLTLEGMRAKPPTAATFRAMELELQASVQHLQLQALEEVRLLSAGYTGAVTLTVTAKGSLEHPDARGEVTLQKVKSDRLKPVDATLGFESGRADTKVVLSAKRGPSRLVELKMNAEAPLETLLDVQKLTGVGFRGDGSIGPFALNDVLEPAGEETQPRGTVKATVEMLGTVVDPKVTLRGQVEQVAVGKVALGKANVAYDYQDALSKLSATLFTGERGRMRLEGTVKLDLSQPAVMKGLEWRDAPLAVDVSSSDLDLAFLSGAIEAVPKLEGQLDAKATVSGTLALPVLVGSAHWKNGRIAVQGYGEYREIEVELDGSPEKLTLSKLFAKSGGGWAAVSGVAFKRGEQWQAQLTGESKNFPIITDDQLKASLTTELKAEGLYSATLIDLRRVTIPRAVIELPEVKGKELQDLERPESIVLVRNGVPVNARQKRKLQAIEKQEPTAQPPPARTIRISVDAPNNLWVKSSDVNAEAGLSEGFRVEVAQGASLFGEVQVKRGRLDVIGRRFDLEPASTVKFSGPPNRAYVNIRAIHKNEREGVTVFATVVGQLPQFQIRLDSNPPLSDTDIFALIATGRRTLKQGGSAAITNDQVASVLGSFAASQLKGVLGKKLPLDVLSIETGSQGLKGTRVEGGKYLTDEVYLGVEARYGADPKKGENDVAAKVEYQFVPHWSVEAYGGNAAYGADLMWSREY